MFSRPLLFLLAAAAVSTASAEDKSALRLPTSWQTLSLSRFKPMERSIRSNSKSIALVVCQRWIALRSDEIDLAIIAVPERYRCAARRVSRLSLSPMMLL